MKKPQPELSPRWVSALRRLASRVEGPADAWSRITSGEAAPQQVLQPRQRRAQLAVIGLVVVAIAATAVLVRARDNNEPVRSAGSTSSPQPPRSTTPPAPQGIAALFSRGWTLSAVQDHGRLVPLPEAVSGARIRFDPGVACSGATCDPGASVSGSDGCNDYGGTITIRGSTITTGTFGSTLVGCTGPSSLISGIFTSHQRRVHFQVLGDRLRLTSTDGVTVTYVAPGRPAAPQPNARSRPAATERSSSSPMPASTSP